MASSQGEAAGLDQEVHTSSVRSDASDESPPQAAEPPVEVAESPTELEVTAEASPSPSASGELHALGNRLKWYGVILLSVVIDLMFLGLWLAVHQLAKIFIFDQFERPHGLEGATLLSIEVLFNVTTLGVVGAYVVRDSMQSVKSIWQNR